MTPSAAERERCARLIELIAADWREAGADQKVWASEYLARQIRELGDIEQTAVEKLMATGMSREEAEREAAIATGLNRL
jgi:hypothetical protein